MALVLTPVTAGIMETKLLTYSELADALGITTASAKRLAIRRRWPKQPGNDGRSRVLVPVERLLVERTPATGDGTGDSTSDDTAVVTNEAISDVTSDRLIVITTLTRHIERLEQDLTAAKAERDRAAARAVEAAAVPALRTTIDALKAALDSERGRVADLRIERDRLVEQMAKRAARSWWPFRRRA